MIFSLHAKDFRSAYAPALHLRIQFPIPGTVRGASMEPWTEKELSDGYHNFWRDMDYDRSMDQKLEPFLKLNPAGPWLRELRQAYWLTHRTLGKKMNEPPSWFAKQERHEKRGTITLNNLRKYADSLDCELVYAVRPKNRLKPSRHLWNLVINGMKRKNRMHIWVQARDRAITPKFRRVRGWVRNPVSYWENRIGLVGYRTPEEERVHAELSEWANSRVSK